MNKFLSATLLITTLPVVAFAQNANPTAPAPDQNYCTHEFSVGGGLRVLADGLCSAGNNMIALLSKYQSDSSDSSSATHSLLGKISSGSASVSTPTSAPPTATPTIQTAPQTPTAPATTQSRNASPSNPYAYS